MWNQLLTLLLRPLTSSIATRSSPHSSLSLPVLQPGCYDREFQYTLIFLHHFNPSSAKTNAKIGEYLGITEWNTTTSQGATIKAAADFAMLQTPTAEGDGPPSELYPSIAAVGAAYGDPDGKYA